MTPRDVLGEAKAARAAVDAAEDELVAARSELHTAIRQLAADGWSMREISQELGLSHQRVHQIVSGETSTRSRPRKGRNLVVGVVVAVMIAAGSAALGLSYAARGPETPAPDAFPFAEPRVEPGPDDQIPLIPWEDPPPCPGGPQANPQDCTPPKVIPLALHGR
jgi:hypothetical protein